MQSNHVPKIIHTFVHPHNNDRAALLGEDVIYNQSLHNLLKWYSRLSSSIWRYSTLYSISLKSVIHCMYICIKGIKMIKTQSEFVGF